MKPPAPIGNTSAVDRDNPWPGLASFTEDARGFFFGRENETEELSRLVRRQTLTVLFGQSGLGKSSLIQAGLFPLLREGDHLPLYLRLDHDTGAPALAEQVKASLTAAFAAEKTDAPAFRADETLWEYFHRKDVDIWSAKNRLLTPVLAFDQFEEIFTLGRADAASSERSRAFLAELTCLVENRPPAAVQARLDRGELDPARFNFAKPSCSVILSLREDFLPDLEGLKREMPALIHNRLRLKKLSGTQALDIVQKPAPHLLAPGVAEKIVEFVAGARGGSAERLAELDVEPPLLSVICRELNDRRRALGQEHITADLVSGNRREILHDFYERSVADLPAPMRAFVEDHLLTKSGFRDNLALETALEFPGVTRPLLDTLVARRLLRIEDRLGVQRVELTHDVLAEVIRAARDERQAGNALEAEERRRREAEQALAQAVAEKAAARRSLWRARAMLAVCILLAIAAVIGIQDASQARTRAERLAGIADQSRSTAVKLQAQAAQARDKAEAEHKLSDTARTQAEALANTLLVDFYDELEPTARYDTIARLAERVVAYYDGLPAELHSPLTERRRALALIRQGSAVRGQGKFDAGDVLLSQGVAAFEKLVTGGDKSNGTAQGLAIALLEQVPTARLRNDPAANLEAIKRAVELLRPLAAAANSSIRSRREYGRSLAYLASVQTDPAVGLPLLEESRQVIAKAGGADLSDIISASGYAQATRMAAIRLAALNRYDEADRYRTEALSVLDRILAKQPGVLFALFVRGQAEADLCNVEAGRYHYAAAIDLALKAEKTWEELLRFNPVDPDAWQQLAVARIRTANLLIQRGRINDGVEKYHAATKIAVEQQSAAEAIGSVPAAFFSMAHWESARGHREAAGQALAEGLRTFEAVRRERQSTDFAVAVLRLLNFRSRERLVKWNLDDYAGLIADTEEDEKTIARLLQSPEATAADRQNLESQRAISRIFAGLALVMLGRFAEAEPVQRAVLAELQVGGETTMAKSVNEANRREWLAYNLVRQNRRAEALKVVAPAVAYFRDRMGKGDDTLDLKFFFSWALYVQALAQPDDDAGRAARRAALDEAEQLMASCTDEAKQLHDERRLIDWIAEARGK